MYKLWKDKFITKPSDFWNMSYGDKVFLQAFHEQLIIDKNEERREIKDSEVPVFQVNVI